MTTKKPIFVSEIVKKYTPLISETKGDTSVSFDEISPLHSATNHSLVYVNSEKNLNLAVQSRAQVIVCPLNLKDKALAQKVWLFSPNPELLITKVKNEYILKTPYQNADFKGIHSTAIVDKSAKLGKSVVVGPYAVISSECVIGDNSYIGAHSVIENGVHIGNNTTIHPHVYIGHHGQIGSECEVMPHTTVGSEGFGYSHDEKGNHFRIPHTGRVVLEDKVQIGTHCSIDRGNMDDTIIRTGTIVDNHCHFGHNTEVGEKSIITAFFVSAGSAKIGKYFIAGGRTTVNGHTKVCDGVNVAALTAIHSDIDKPGKYGGYPVLPINEYLKFRVNLGHLNQMRKQINEILKKLNIK